MIFSFVIPELLLAVALFLLVTQGMTFIRLGTPAEVAGLVLWNISWPAIIVRAADLDRTDVRGGGRRSRSVAARGDPSGAASDADARDLRERGAGVRQHRGRFRNRRAAVQRPWGAEWAGAERLGHDHAVRLARGR
jgi:hypothetical protein